MQSVQEFDCVLAAVGRIPNTDLNLSSAVYMRDMFLYCRPLDSVMCYRRVLHSLQPDTFRFVQPCIFNMQLAALWPVQTDEYQNTTAKGVYAIGDVSGFVQLTPGACMHNMLLCAIA